MQEGDLDQVRPCYSKSRCVYTQYDIHHHMHYLLTVSPVCGFSGGLEMYLTSGTYNIIGL